MGFPKKLNTKLKNRTEANALRKLNLQHDLVDFSSNDYLGIARSKDVFNSASQYVKDHDMELNGATGSRLLSGNHHIYNHLEKFLKTFHDSEAALVFNSGYDANIGFFSSVPQRGDIILFDEFIHASIRDGIKMSDARSYKFKHNDIEHFQELLIRHSEPLSQPQQDIFVVTESVFSMDGDTPDLIKMSTISKRYNAHLIVDEAHAVGLFGEKGHGIIQDLGITEDVFARVITFGKALGCHGAAILGSEKLRQYLINFSRSFIYTTGLSPHSVATVLAGYEYLIAEEGMKKVDELVKNIAHFKSNIKKLGLENIFITSDSAIQCCLISGNEKVKTIATALHGKGFDVKPILSPTIPKGQERLRFCLHSYNSQEEIEKVLETLRIFVE